MNRFLTLVTSLTIALLLSGGIVNAQDNWIDHQFVNEFSLDSGVTSEIQYAGGFTGFDVQEFDKAMFIRARIVSSGPTVLDDTLWGIVQTAFAAPDLSDFDTTKNNSAGLIAMAWVDLDSLFIAAEEPETATYVFPIDSLVAGETGEFLGNLIRIKYEAHSRAPDEPDSGWTVTDSTLLIKTDVGFF